METNIWMGHGPIRRANNYLTWKDKCLDKPTLFPDNGQSKMFHILF